MVNWQQQQQLLLNLQQHRRVLKWGAEASTITATSAGTIQRYTQTNPCIQDAAQVLNWGWGLPPARVKATTNQTNHQKYRKRKKIQEPTTHLRPLWHALGFFCFFFVVQLRRRLLFHRNMRHDSGIKLQKRCKMPKCSRGPDFASMLAKNNIKDKQTLSDNNNNNNSEDNDASSHFN